MKSILSILLFIPCWCWAQSHSYNEIKANYFLNKNKLDSAEKYLDLWTAELNTELKKIMQEWHLKHDLEKIRWETIGVYATFDDDGFQHVHVDTTMWQRKLGDTLKAYIAVRPYCKCECFTHNNSGWFECGYAVKTPTGYDYFDSFGLLIPKERIVNVEIKDCGKPHKFQYY